MLNFNICFRLAEMRGEKLDEDTFDEENEPDPDPNVQELPEKVCSIVVLLCGTTKEKQKKIPLG